MFFLLDREGLQADADLQAMALLQAAIYRLHCRHRRSEGFLDDEVLRRALDQAVKESTMGHSGAMRLLDGIWISTSSPTSSPSEAAS